MENQPTQAPQTPTPEPTPTPETTQPQQPTPPATTPPKAQPVLGFVSLGLAIVGTILACIPAILIIGLFVLFAAFVVSLVAIFKKNTAKWPAIVGLVLSVLAGIVGSIIFVIALTVNLVDRANQATTKDTPSTQQPADTKEEQSSSRPSPEEIAESIKTANQENNLTTYDDMPDFYPCVGDFIYKSELSDETVRLLTDRYDPLPEERDLATKVIQDSVFKCDPQPTDKYIKR